MQLRSGKASANCASITVPDIGFTLFDAARNLCCFSAAATKLRKARISREPKSWQLSWRIEMVKTRPFDAAEVLDSPEMIAAYLTEAFGSDDPALMARAIGAVA